MPKREVYLQCCGCEEFLLGLLIWGQDGSVDKTSPLVAKFVEHHGKTEENSGHGMGHVYSNLVDLEEDKRNSEVRRNFGFVSVNRKGFDTGRVD